MMDQTDMTAEVLPSLKDADAHELAEAIAAVLDSKKGYDIKVLPGSMTPGYESWWRVGVAEVSTQPRVQAAYEDLMAHVKETREF